MTFLSPLPPCEAKDVVVLNSVPSGKGTLRTIVCRRDYDSPATDILQHYRRVFEAAGYSVRAAWADRGNAHLGARRGELEIELYVQWGEAGLPSIEIIHEWRP